MHVILPYSTQVQQDVRFFPNEAQGSAQPKANTTVIPTTSCMSVASCLLLSLPHDHSSCTPSLYNPHHALKLAPSQLLVLGSGASTPNSFAAAHPAAPRLLAQCICCTDLHAHWLLLRCSLGPNALSVPPTHHHQPLFQRTHAHTRAQLTSSSLCTSDLLKPAPSSLPRGPVMPTAVVVHRLGVLLLQRAAQLAGVPRTGQGPARGQRPQRWAAESKLLVRFCVKESMSGRDWQGGVCG